ncbi:DUF4193 family protein [Arthrobacter psychrochitiniphilus]|uniref:DUF4193 family protein n=1 Tax=Arthrobacter psychrochitiniphilus TaxID=291045 RepID=UPI003493EE7B
MLAAVQSVQACDILSTVQELDETQDLEESQGPSAEFIDEELIVQVMSPSEDEFICCLSFLVHHRSQIARQSYGTGCEG